MKSFKTDKWVVANVSYKGKKYKSLFILRFAVPTRLLQKWVNVLIISKIFSFASISRFF